MARTILSLDRVSRRLRDASILLGTEGPQDLDVSGVSQDSRDVSPGDLFVAWKGVDHDAHDFVSSAVEAGAVAAVVERLLPELPVAQLQVSDGRLAGALAADEVLGSPWKELFLAGVTGTNGKTTVAVLTRHLLAGKGRARAIGTLGVVEEEGRVAPGTEGLTTPGPVQFSEWIREMADDGVGYVTLEASSHALAQSRLDGTRMDVVVLTNLTQDHLDYHEDLADYLGAKARVLNLLKPGGWAVVNGEERAWDTLSLPPGRTLFYEIDDEEGASSNAGPGESSPPHLCARELFLEPFGSRFTLASEGESEAVYLPLMGRFNVENALAAAGVARLAGLTLTEIAEGLASAPQVPGRLERIVEEPFSVLIDFAHTDDALERVLLTLRPLVQGRLMVLFGAGGDRDRGKRPKMGAVAAELADLAFVTSDNPRTEDPEAIIDDVVEGMGRGDFRRVTDRRQAIASALAEARRGDLLLLAGKGHETYQVVGREKLPFDEREIVREIMVDEPGEGGP
jgi:UDP-N-acetylmuramoyl-L-alanyl-D-glutamate--2,6-diaminopimelate ligase